MAFLARLSATAIALVLAASAALAEMPKLRIAVQEAGTVNWEIDTILHYGLDRANGFELDVMGVASGDAGDIAFQGGAADAMVSDWLWVARQRAAGKDFVFLPYSRAVGGVMVPADSDATSLADLRGGKVGIAGGPLDKSWLILRAYARQEIGMDLAAETEQVYGAPPLIFRTALAGDLEGAINFWHYMAKMEAGGMRTLIGVDEAAHALGLSPDTPLLGYVLTGEMVRARPDVIEGLAAASRQAKDLLATDQAAWERLRGRMNAGNDAEFEALKAGFLAGIPAPGPVDEAAAERMLKVMTDLGSDDLLGGLTELPDGLFVRPGS